MNIAPSRITFVGGGNMARALIGGLLARDGALPIAVVDPVGAARQALLERHPRLEVAGALAELAAVEQSRLIVLAVKPQQMRAAVRPLAALLPGTGAVVVSIAAGIRLDDLARWLNGYGKLVRAMPNTPALIGKGIAGLYARDEVSAEDKAHAAQVLAAVGEVVWVAEESMLDAVTGVSGSGPAYVFYFLEALERAARELGFAPDVARRLAYATFSGAMALAEASESPPATLRAQVTSKGGTTERAIETMEARAVAEAIVAAVRDASVRSRELGDLLGRDAQDG